MRGTTFESYQERILRVLVHIQQHLDEPLPLEDLAGVACFSPFHFHRVFRGMVGESVKEHVRRLRLERAAHRLRFTSNPVTDIAFEAGYLTHESFTRAFHAAFEASPSEFRESRRAVSGASAPSGVHFTQDQRPPEFRPRMPGNTHSLEAPRIQSFGPQRVLFLRHVGPYEEVGATWNQLMAWAWKRGLMHSLVGALGIVHDDPEVTPEEKLRYDAALPAQHGASPEGEIGLQEIPAARYAVATHRGPYNLLGETYAQLCGVWLPATGEELASAPALEFYRNSPRTAPPEQLVTEIYLPLAS